MSGVRLSRLNDKNAVDFETGIDQLVLGNYKAALTHLQAAVKTAPKDADAHLWLGMAYLKLRRPLLAKAEWTEGRVLGRGSSQSDEANKLMLESASDMNQSDLGSGISSPPDPALKELTNGTPTVVGFYASWCQQCDNVEKNFNKAQALFGDRIRFVKVNVEDTANAPLMKVLNVGPVPTFVFLTKDGRQKSSILGETSEVNFALGINGILE
jgi:thioredoxin 1